MLPAAYKQAQSPDGLRRLIRSALVLDALGGATDHLAGAIAFGAEEQGMSEEAITQAIADVRREVYP